jgi:mannose-6-phosphate isomerase-like protein (cupin superfamily)
MYKDIVVEKPWGREYLAYENEHVGLWYLFIKKDQSTSMHCHPRKNTGLVCLDGTIETSFLNDSFKIQAPNKLMIRRGLFHSTKAISDAGAHIFEIEAPKLKHDLVRLEDKYGREFKPYEGKSAESQKDADCLWMEDPDYGTTKTYEFQNTILKIISAATPDQIHGTFPESSIIIFVRGGLFSNNNDPIAQPGDVINGKTWNRLIQNFTIISNTTLITVEK